MADDFSDNDDDQLVLSDDEPQYLAFGDLDDSYSAKSLDPQGNPLSRLSDWSLSLPPSSSRSRSYGGLSDDTRASTDSRDTQEFSDRSDESHSRSRSIISPSPNKVERYGRQLSLVNHGDDRGRKYEYDGVIYYIVNGRFATKDEFNDLVFSVFQG